MPRINIDDSLFNDHRFIELSLKCGNQYLAVGSLYYLWRAAQKYWVPDKKLIPITIFKKLLHADLFEEVGFVKRKRSGFYVHGSEDSFRWLLTIHDHSRKGVESRKKIATVRLPAGDPLSLALVKEKNSKAAVDTITRSLTDNFEKKIEAAKFFKDFDKNLN